MRWMIRQQVVVWCVLWLVNCQIRKLSLSNMKAFRHLVILTITTFTTSNFHITMTWVMFSKFSKEEYGLPSIYTALEMSYNNSCNNIVFNLLPILVTINIGNPRVCRHITFDKQDQYVITIQYFIQLNQHLLQPNICKCIWMERTCTGEMCKCLSIVTWSCHVDMIIFRCLLSFLFYFAIKNWKWIEAFKTLFYYEAKAH